MVKIARGQGRSVGSFRVADVWQTAGVNDRSQLAALGAEINRRTLHRHMLAGVTIVDPGTTWVDDTVTFEPDSTLLPGVQLHGSTSVARGAVVGPDTTLTDVSVGPRATVRRTHGSESVIGADASVGPFAYLRPGTRLGAQGKIGTFVEIKNSHIADGAKVPHLSYIGDASIGEQTNIGAGTITANFDGVHKHRTSIGRNCATGSTTRSSRRSRSETEPRLGREQSYAVMFHLGRSPSPPVRSATSRTGCCASVPERRRPRRPSVPRPQSANHLRKRRGRPSDRYEAQQREEPDAVHREGTSEPRRGSCHAARFGSRAYDGAGLRER